MQSDKSGVKVKTTDRNFIQSLARGLAVIRAFSREHPRLTVAEVAKSARVSRAAARRILLTLEALDYVYDDGRGDYRLGPNILSLGYSYLSALDLPDLARPYMERLVAETGHACSLAVLNDNETVYVARIAGHRLIDMNLTIGSRFPAHFTAAGRVLLAWLPEGELAQRVSAANLKKWTDYSIVDRNVLRREIESVRKQGYAIVRRELDYGVCAIAAPVFDSEGAVTTAINLSIHDPKLNEKTLISKELPALLQTARRISSTARSPIDSRQR